ncbi:MAG: ADP-ribosylation/crystallin J1, partial [Pyrinomonadaceae bacterium]
MSDSPESVVLFRPIGQQEFDLIRDSLNTRFPPRLPQQPIFYPVVNGEYAVQIARDWNAKYNEPKCGYVTRFRVRKSFL